MNFEVQELRNSTFDIQHLILNNVKTIITTGNKRFRAGSGS
jgi:hypothetical protein